MSVNQHLTLLIWEPSNCFAWAWCPFVNGPQVTMAMSQPWRPILETTKPQTTPTHCHSPKHIKVHTHQNTCRRIISAWSSRRIISESAHYFCLSCFHCVLSSCWYYSIYGCRGRATLCASILTTLHYDDHSRFHVSCVDAFKTCCPVLRQRYH